MCSADTSTYRNLTSSIHSRLSNWGLPDDGRTYSYNCFPSLEKNFFGNVRAPRQLTRVPEQQRSINESRHAAMMQTLMKGDSASKLGISGGGAGGVKSGEAPKPRKKDLEWALHLLVYKENLMLVGSERSKKAIPTSSMKEANNYIMNTKEKQVRECEGVVRSDEDCDRSNAINTPSFAARFARCSARWSRPSRRFRSDGGVRRQGRRTSRSWPQPSTFKSSTGTKPS